MGCFGSASSKADHEESKRGKETNKKINQQLQKDKQVYRATHRLLLLGKFCKFGEKTEQIKNKTRFRKNINGVAA